jgi:uncharacterized protein YndB with AHSA1/START domain
MNEPAFSTWIIVAVPPEHAFEAVADPAILSRYFTTGGAQGRMASGETVTWDFADFPGAFPVDVDEAVEAERIRFHWGEDKDGQFRTRVDFVFEPIDGGKRTKVRVAESGWPDGDAGLKDAFGKCMGWSQMLAAMKAWVEHGINLREGAYE